MMTHFVSTINTFGHELSAQMGLQPAAAALTPEEMGLPSVALMVRLVSVHVEAVRRCRELSQGQDLPRTASALCKLLIETIGVKYLEAALDVVIEDAQNADPRLDPDLTTPLSIVHVSTHILQLLQIHFQKSILPAITLSPTTHRDMVVYKNDFMSAVEYRLNVLLQKVIDAVTNWLAALLAKQKKFDYRPKEEGGVGISVTACADFLLKVNEAAKKYLDGENGEIFLTEIGVSFHSMLLDHYKKFTVSHTGGLILSKDLSKYQEVITHFHIPALTTRFDMLRDLGNLFVVKAESLKTVVNEGALAKIELSLLYPYLCMRADWVQMGK
ncbi:Exocyst complex component 5, partial [Borealophlyctis nickersoniae]